MPARPWVRGGLRFPTRRLSQRCCLPFTNCGGSSVREDFGSKCPPGQLGMDDGGQSRSAGNVGESQLNLTVFVPKDNQLSGRLHGREICDPVSSSEYAYKIDGIVVSDFVYPAWFESFRAPGSTQFDHASHVSAPFEVASDSYVTYCDFKASSGCQPVFGQQHPY